jgi:hypothetical protein
VNKSILFFPVEGQNKETAEIRLYNRGGGELVEQQNKEEEINWRR